MNEFFYDEHAKGIESYAPCSTWRV